MEINRKTVIVGAVVAVTIVLVALIVVLKGGSGKDACCLVDLEPKADITKQRAIPSLDNRALVRFAAHLSLWTLVDGKLKTHKYLDLNPQQVQYAVAYDNHNHLVLDTDCSVVDIKVNQNNTAKAYQFERMTIKSKTSHASYDKCYIPLDDISFGQDSYWSCPKSKTYYCADQRADLGTSDKLLLVGIQFDLLEIELDGDKTSIAAGKFEKIKKECS